MLSHAALTKHKDRLVHVIHYHQLHPNSTKTHSRLAGMSLISRLFKLTRDRLGLLSLASSATRPFFAGFASSSTAAGSCPSTATGAVPRRELGGREEAGFADAARETGLELEPFALEAGLLARDAGLGGISCCLVGSSSQERLKKV